jgi:hypothetical protein
MVAVANPYWSIGTTDSYLGRLGLDFSAKELPNWPAVMSNRREVLIGSVNCFCSKSIFFFDEEWRKSNLSLSYKELKFRA